MTVIIMTDDGDDDIDLFMLGAQKFHRVKGCAVPLPWYDSLLLKMLISTLVNAGQCRVMQGNEDSP